LGYQAIFQLDGWEGVEIERSIASSVGASLNGL